MKNTDERPASGPGRPPKYSEALVRKELLLLNSQVLAIERIARETSEERKRPVSFSEILRDLVGVGLDKRG